jgi:hypothetical protein
MSGKQAPQAGLRMAAVAGLITNARGATAPAPQRSTVSSTERSTSRRLEPALVHACGPTFPAAPKASRGVSKSSST